MTNKILLVEDSEDDIFFLQHAFERASIVGALEVVRDGQQALEYLRGEGRYGERTRYPLPSLIMLDLQLPQLSGFDVLGWLRQQEALQCLPVMIFSSSARVGDVDRAYRAGANAFVVKPGSVEERVVLATHIKGFWLHFNEPPSSCGGAGQTSGRTELLD